MFQRSRLSGFLRLLLIHQEENQDFLSHYWKNRPITRTIGQFTGKFDVFTGKVGDITNQID